MARRTALEREIGRLEAQLDPKSSERVIDELATVRRGLSDGGVRAAAIELPNLRIGFACKQRWEDMRGDERVRACAGCERPVFNLSEMTREEAERVLATRGLTPCVRFYRRPDGTVMTTDCPTSQKRDGRRLAIVASSLALAAPTSAAAQPAPDDAVTTPDPNVTTPDHAAPQDPTTPPLKIEDSHTMGIPVPGRTFDTISVEMGVVAIPERPQRPRIGWSIWSRLGMGVARKPAAVLARTSMPPAMEPASGAIREAALVADLTFGVARDGDIRVGAWGELRTSSGPVVGGELLLEGLPRHPYASRRGGSVVLRAGANAHIVTGALGFGYSWSSRDDGWADQLGARLVTSLTKSRDVPHEWSATIGVEIEPIGAIKAVFDFAKDTTQ